MSYVRSNVRDTEEFSYRRLSAYPQRSEASVFYLFLFVIVGSRLTGAVFDFFFSDAQDSGEKENEQQGWMERGSN